MKITGGIKGKLIPFVNLNNEQDRRECKKFTALLKENVLEYMLVSTSSLTFLFIKEGDSVRYYEVVKLYKAMSGRN